MPKSWKYVARKIDEEREKIRFNPPDEVLKIFRYGIIDSGAGAYGQYFTTMVFVEGDCRALAYYNGAYLIVMAQEELFDLRRLKMLAKQYLPVGAEFLGYCGLRKLWQFTKEVLDALDSLESKEDFIELINSFNIYVSCIHSWIHHFFPWNIGVLFPQRRPDEIREMFKLISSMAER